MTEKQHSCSHYLWQYEGLEVDLRPPWNVEEAEKELNKKEQNND